MKLAWAMLADHAQSRDGLAFIIAGGIDTVYAGELPARLFASLILQLSFRPSEAGKHTVTVLTIDDDGAEIARMEGELGMTSPAGLPSSWDSKAMFAVTLNGLPLPNYGVYRMDILVDNRAEGELNLRVVRPAEPNREQRRRQPRK